MKVIVSLRRGNSGSHHSLFHPTAGAAGVAIRSTAKSEGENCHLEEELHFKNSFPVSEIISSLVYAYLCSSLKLQV